MAAKKNEFRLEKDTMGTVKVPAEKYWGAQTERSRNNFKIGPPSSMPLEIIYAYAILKKAAAITNHELGILSQEKKNWITIVCDEIISGKHDSQFPLVIWQTGSGTQTNMNVNEVIANRAKELAGFALTDEKGVVLSPNDDVNLSQSSNDTFPTAIHIAAYQLLAKKTIPALKELKTAISEKQTEFKNIVKIGRTHLMDATPLTLGQVFSGYAAQLGYGIDALERSLGHLSELALGGTAVGTGINSPQGYAPLVAKTIAELTSLPFRSAPNKFEALSANDALVETHSALKQLAISLNKIANDIRLLASGPRAGIGELILPANEPGSSIMPGKVNPTQCEALTMVCAQVMGNDTAIAMGATQGHLELNVFKPLLAYNLLQSANLLADACISFKENCVVGIQANEKVIQNNLNNSLMLVTALNAKIGYYKAAEIANLAFEKDFTLKEAAISLGYLTAEEYDEWVDPKKMV